MKSPFIDFIAEELNIAKLYVSNEFDIETPFKNLQDVQEELYDISEDEEYTDTEDEDAESENEIQSLELFTNENLMFDNQVAAATTWANAIKLNKQYAYELGWAKYRQEINVLLIESMGQIANRSLVDAAFASAVAQWQFKKKLNPGFWKGSIDPVTWSLIRPLIKVKPTGSPSCDLTIAVTPFEISQQQKITTPLLSPVLSKKAIKWNLANLPKLKVDPAHALTDLKRYVDLDLVKIAIDKYNIANPSNKIEMGTPPIDAVFAEAVHQFQKKTYIDEVAGEKKYDGRTGPGTLHSLGIISFAQNPKDLAISQNAKKQLENLKIKMQINGKECNYNNWFSFTYNPSFLGISFNRPVHYLLIKQLRMVESYLLNLPKFKGDNIVDMAFKLGLNKKTEKHAGGRLAGGGMHTFGLAVDIDHGGSPWIGAGFIQKPKNYDALDQATKKRIDTKLNEKVKFLETLEIASGGKKLKGKTISQYLHSVGVDKGANTYEAYNELKQRHDEFIRYLQTNAAELAYWNSSATFGYRDPIKGFLNLDADLVYALREKANLAWGAIDIGAGPGGSGDIMHFDMRTIDIGRKINQNKPGSAADPVDTHPYLKKAKVISKELDDETIDQAFINNQEDADEFTYEDHMYEVNENENENVIESKEEEILYKEMEEENEVGELESEKKYNEFDMKALDENEAESEEYENEIFEDFEPPEQEFSAEVADAVNEDSTAYEESKGETHIHNHEYIEAELRGKDALDFRLLYTEQSPPGKTIYINSNLKISGTDNITGIFVPKSFKATDNLELIIYLHGYKFDTSKGPHVCYKGICPTTNVDSYWKNPMFPLREALNSSARNSILVVPTIGVRSNAGSLIKDRGFDLFISHILRCLVCEKVISPCDTIGKIILAAHSGGGSPILRIATLKDQYAKLVKECWCFDALYGGTQQWINWINANTERKFYSYYFGSTPATISEEIRKECKRLPAGSIRRSDVRHHWYLVKTYWNERIADKKNGNEFVKEMEEKESGHEPAMDQFTPAASKPKTIWLNNTDLNAPYFGGNFNFLYNGGSSEAVVTFNTNLSFRKNFPAAEKQNFIDTMKQAVDIWDKAAEVQIKDINGNYNQKIKLRFKLNIVKNSNNANKKTDIHPGGTWSSWFNGADREIVMRNLNVFIHSSRNVLAHELGHVWGLLDEYDTQWIEMKFSPGHVGASSPLLKDKVAIMNLGYQDEVLNNGEFRGRYFIHFGRKILEAFWGLDHFMIPVKHNGKIIATSVIGRIRLLKKDIQGNTPYTADQLPFNPQFNYIQIAKRGNYSKKNKEAEWEEEENEMMNEWEWEDQEYDEINNAEDELEEPLMEMDEYSESETIEDNFIEEFVPKIALPDIRKRIDDYFDKANSEYKTDKGAIAKVWSQFRIANGDTISSEDAKTKVKKALSGKSCGISSLLIHNAAYGRAKPTDVAKITQCLINAGELAKLRAQNTSLSDEKLIRLLQREFGIGIDCGGYVQLAFIFAYTGSDNDTATVRNNLGLKERRGHENLGSLPAKHFEKIDILDAQTGDLIIMNPRANDDGSIHTVIIVEHTKSGNVHKYVVDSSWGFLYGDTASGISRRTFEFDTSTSEWSDIHPVSGNKVYTNSIGPYKGHPIKEVYRARLKK